MGNLIRPRLEQGFLNMLHMKQKSQNEETGR